jgi:sugar O-acyltransferase (sialic acid O-acetyltransferase NeuD family)
VNGQIILHVPQENANDDKVRVVSVNFGNLEFVKRGDSLFEFETSKSIVEYESPVDGFFSSFVIAGQEVKVGSPIGAVSSEKTLVTPPKVIEKASAQGLDARFSKKALALMAEHQIESNIFDGFLRVSEADVIKILNKTAEPKSLVNSEEELTIIKKKNFEPDHIILYGAGLQAEVVLDLLASSGRLDKLVFIIDTSPKIQRLHGVNVITASNLELIRQLGGKNIHICIGNADAKRNVAKKLIELGFSIVSLIHPSAVVSSFASIGPGAYIGPLVNIGPYVTIGAYCQINNGSSIAHHSRLDECVMISDGCHIGGSVHIKSDVLLGISVSVNRDLIIGEAASVPTGERVLNSVADGEVIRFNRRVTIK